MPRLLPVFLTILFLTAPANAQNAVSARFDVHVYGIKVGELRIASRSGAGKYSATARFATSGLVARLRNVRLLMNTTGTGTAGALRPLLYTEDVNTGRRQSSAQMRYRGGVPTLTGRKPESRDGAAPLDPALQRGTLDPLTAMLLTLRDQPARVECGLDLQVFDGARRTRVVLEQGAGQDANPVCTGQFLRVAGYSAERLARDGRVPIRIVYAPGGGGMQVQQLFMTTSRGRVTLTRR